VKNRESFNELASNLEAALTTAGDATKEFSNPQKLREFEDRAAAAKTAEEKLAVAVGD